MHQSALTGRGAPGTLAAASQPRRQRAVHRLPTSTSSSGNAPTHVSTRCQVIVMVLTYVMTITSSYYR